MSEHFTPLSFERLCHWITTEYRDENAIFGIPGELFYQPEATSAIRQRKYDQLLETPLGVAAGPHTQLTQNIIMAWVAGARFIELKTVQTLDELVVSKPCIDMEDEGYNCEWSQELKLKKSYHEYLKAWVLIHLMHDWLDFEHGQGGPGTIFNMSVGYNLEGIMNANVQEFLASMADAAEDIARLRTAALPWFPNAEAVEIPTVISDNVTLSTMHGCPPAEIEKIATYLVKEKGYHTTIKFNPTLLGKDRLRGILNDTLGFPTEVPDEAFGHDPVYADALGIINAVRQASTDAGRDFSFKLSNTLESKNNRNVFPGNEPMMYMSGRALHPIDINLADRLMNEYNGEIPISFSGGIDAFNLYRTYACGIQPLTVCSDILKPGGYGRLRQFLEVLEEDMKQLDCMDQGEYVVKFCFSQAAMAPALIRSLEGRAVNLAVPEIIAALDRKLPGEKLDSVLSSLIPEESARIAFRATLVAACGCLNISAYASDVLAEERYRKDYISDTSSKNQLELGAFDCIAAPCTVECPIHQNIPDYMHCVAIGDLAGARDVVLKDNPIPTIAGGVCDHLCQTKCVRSHYDQPLAIREVKRFIMEQSQGALTKGEPIDKRVAIIGAGPAGLSAAFFLARAGAAVHVYEYRHKAGGMVSFAIPPFRLSEEKIDLDVAAIEKMGVKFHFGVRIGTDVSFETLRQDHDAIFIAAGAQQELKLGLEGENADGICDFLTFLERFRKGEVVHTGLKVGVIGGGNSAMDVARAAWRSADKPEVKVIYRRTEKEMPADREEIDELKHEGIEIVELAAPHRLVLEAGRLKGLECQRMELGEPDSSGRRRPVPVPGSEFVIELDTLVVAISQKPALDFLENSGIEFNRNGTIKVDSESFETTIPGVYSGGDVTRGPATLIKAAGDGKRIACRILGISPDSKNSMEKSVSRRELLLRKSRKEYPVYDVGVSLNDRRNFDEAIRTMTIDEAVTEAKRCFYCDQMCSICTTVCPNHANIDVQISAVNWQIPVITVQSGAEVSREQTAFAVAQDTQILNVGDMCNECGNCTTFCPTSGAPFEAKTTLYLDRDAFTCHTEDGIYARREGERLIVQMRVDGQLHTLTRTHGNADEYQGPALTCKLLDDLKVDDLKVTVDGVHSLQPAALLKVLAGGLASCSYLPLD